MRASRGQKRATQTQLALATRDGFGHQRGFQQVVIRPRNADDALIFQALVRVYAGV